MGVELGVLGAVAGWDATGTPLALKGPRHRALLARLVVAHGRAVPLSMLVDDLWDDPPHDAVGAIRTFVGDLRRAVEPERPPRAAARHLVTEGTGYALRMPPDAVDAVRFERAVHSAPGRGPEEALAVLDRALSWWRGPAYADVPERHWVRVERARLTELRLSAVELRAVSLLGLARAAESVADLDAHVAEHPWREEGWRLLALALYRTGRQGEALDVLRRARSLLLDELGIEPGRALHTLESDILHQAEHLDPAPDDGAGRVWAQAAASYDRTVPSGSRARLRSTVDLLRSLAITGGSGLETARRQRLATILAAEELDDADLTARVIGAYDVPAIWTRSDDAEQAAQIVAAAERTLIRLGPGAKDATRARLLATIAVESRGDAGPRGRQAADQAEQIARGLDDPALLAFALNGAFIQSFHRAGLADRRAALGAELVDLGARHELATHELLGRLICLQASCALGDLALADAHAALADELAARYDSPLVAVFTGWYRALRLGLTEQPDAAVESAYRSAASALEGSGMPGLERGLLPLALLCLRVERGRSAPTEEGIDWGPYEPWVRPLVLLAQGRRAEAADAVRRVPDPPHDHLLEALWGLTARAAMATGNRVTMRRALAALAPAESEIAGAGSGILSLGPDSRILADLTRGLEAPGTGSTAR